MSEENKAMVRRMVDAINAGEEAAVVEELFAPRAARRVQRLFAQFRSAFPDWQEETVTLVAEGNTVAGRFKCSGTHRGEFLGEAPTGKRMEVEEVFFLREEDGKFVDFLALEDQPGQDTTARAHALTETLRAWDHAGFREPSTRELRKDASPWPFSPEYSSSLPWWHDASSETSLSRFEVPNCGGYGF